MNVTLTSNIDRKIAKLRHMGKRFSRAEYLTLIGMDALDWVNRNFRDEGAEKKWKPMSPNTRAARPGGKLLRDTGRLAQSFAVKKSVAGGWVKIGSSDRKAPWHHFGTRPYTIKPRRAKVLRFMTAKGEAFSHLVRHPGLPSRPLLPSKRKAGKIAKTALNTYVKTLVKEWRE